MHHPDTIPEAALRACPGYRIADAGEPVARSAQRHREAGRRVFQAGSVPGSRRKRLSRATGSQTPGNP
ncbi:hypothetical protein AAFL49_18635 [Klebsiella michiganensis]|uniref:hypothetical protein n=1 Tax=Klebsiella michiganensis TaxID=1134687 RepID=UPI001C27BD86|nr:hypothetical protein [Klebsiella michiganensis]NRG23663.1 hypothetical protein [Klebsiella michiganensis]